MKSFDTELQKHALKMRLKAAEQRELRERILSYMEYHPLPKQEVTHTSLHAQGEYWYIPFNSLNFKIASGVFATLFFVVVPLWAEYSVPGDALYLIKTEVNEGIQSTLANSPYEKVTFETRLIERRLSEARLLASEGKLTEDVQAKIIETVQGHADAVQSNLAELRASDAEGAAIAEIEVGSALEVQSAVLGMNDNSKESSSVENLLSVVNTVRVEVAENPESIVPSFDALTARVETETTRLHELFESVKTSASPEEIVDIERRIADIDRAIIAAKELREADETGAIVDMSNALGLIQKVIAFMTDIDVRETVALETLVPIVLTLEERTAAFSELYNNLAQRRTLIEEAVASNTIEQAVLNKIAEGTEQFDMLAVDAIVYRDNGDMDGAEMKISDASLMLVDIESLIKPVIPPVDEIIDSVVIGTTTDDGVTDVEGDTETGTTTPSEVE